jgi:hypothetical protein
VALGQTELTDAGSKEARQDCSGDDRPSAAGAYRL